MILLLGLLGLINCSIHISVNVDPIAVPAPAHPHSTYSPRVLFQERRLGSDEAEVDLAENLSINLPVIPSWHAIINTEEKSDFGDNFLSYEMWVQDTRTSQMYRKDDSSGVTISITNKVTKMVDEYNYSRKDNTWCLHRRNPSIPTFFPLKCEIQREPQSSYQGKPAVKFIQKCHHSNTVIESFYTPKLDQLLFTSSKDSLQVSTAQYTKWSQIPQGIFNIPRICKLAKINRDIEENSDLNQEFCKENPKDALCGGCEGSASLDDPRCNIPSKKQEWYKNLNKRFHSTN